MDQSSNATGASVSPAMLHEVSRFRAVLSASRSVAQLKLFDFLVERSADARAPKEIEIALAVFSGDGSTTDGPTDSGVRVYVHRLRKRIDEFYADQWGPRLIIPKGEYRLTLQLPEATDEPDSTLDRVKTALFKPARWHWFALTGVLCFAVLAVMLLPASETASDDARRLASTRFWSGLDETTPITLLAGDSFMLAETRDQNTVDRIIRDSAIQSRDQLGAHLKTHPESFYRLYDLDLHYTPVGTALAAWDLQAALPPTRSGKPRRSNVMPLSSANEQTLQRRTILYVGRMGDLGPLATVYRALSKFALEGPNTIRDVVSHKTFEATLPGQDTADTGTTMRDIGAIATMRTPDGRRLIFVTGIGDLALSDMVRLASDPEALRKIEGQSRTGRFYDALFEVRSVDGIHTERRLVAMHPLS